MARGLSCAILAVLMLFSRASALAQSEPRTAAALEDVRSSYQNGVDAAKQGQWPQAYEAFLAAWKVERNDQIAANLGRAEVRLGKYRDAAEHLAYFLRTAKDVATEDRTLAQSLLDEARSRVGTLRIAVDRPGARVSIDGVFIEDAALAAELYVEPGAHLVEASLEGFDTATRQVDVKRGDSQPLALSLPARTAVPATAPIESPGSSRDGRGGPSWTVVGIGAGITTVGLGLGVAGLVMSGKAAATRDERATTAQTYPGCHGECKEEWDSARRAHRTWSKVAAWSFLGAGVTAGATTAYVVMSRNTKEHASGAAVVDVTIYPGGAGLALSRTW